MSLHGRIQPRNPDFSRLFSNRVIARYPAFEEFCGMEDAIEQIVSYLKHAARGWKRRNKSCICCLGPVGGVESSLAERLKSLMQLVPIYVLSANGERSQSTNNSIVFQSAGRCSDSGKEYGIPRRYLGTIMSPSAAKRLHQFGGDIH
ncbi:hypothetical protein ACVXHA_11940 [Escherichia coli]